ncbi:DNA replication protein DnaC [Planococcus glaciei]|uniref:DNA/RNA helicase domain-containing protein n=1 Tax=Planococcus glaciei TaxID=459472 RepID=UPI0008822083|nr:DNA/RNA helicase domain-containing protein [Planococcus glaciei]SDI19893.1 DNA replication protein DnaC [Planococcus glaciei]
MKPINIISLINAKSDLEEPLFILYLKEFEASLRDHEYEDLRSLLFTLRKEKHFADIFEGFYVGFRINQISKEFDLLRFGEKSIINIELKQQSDEEKIKKQLLENRYYLKFLEKEILSYTYVSSEEKLYKLNAQEEIEEIDVETLKEELCEQRLEEIDDIHKLFDPIRYLVSPFNQTAAFIEDEYFLTDHQKNIKKEILTDCHTSGSNFFSIEGAAGTGKTLLTYDIAKEMKNLGKEVLILHTASINSGQRILEEVYDWNISQPKYIRNLNFDDYELIIVDESQRLTSLQADLIIEKVRATNKNCIFSFDPRQTLSEKEKKSNALQIIAQDAEPKSFTLKKKIRTNAELANFIKSLFDLREIKTDQNYSNVTLSYLSEIKDAKEYLESLTDRGWKVISPTPSMYGMFYYEYYRSSGSETAHEVIGQEYDNVACVIDWNFFHNERGQLETVAETQQMVYPPLYMLLQMVTRARKKLNLVIIKNPRVLEGCLKILQQTEFVRK